ncbi:septum formation family protein [Ruania alkalisoli]|uniref:Septum formation family protein n=1 Tax=Ruania alkalisoli TaxID=2779775 RepID=A0A7M1SSP5_9MICO|nr:septum formation family protein [Ruania alkalisoli]QOR70167.1 septum formation family protein [Ruania alkalisoli]
MNTRTLTRSALAVVGVAGLTASMSACSLLGGSVASAEVGACVDTTSMGTEEITEIPTVDCSEEHDAQVFHKFDMPDGDYPGTEGIQTAAQEGCIAEFDAFVGAAYEDSALDINYIGPSAESWDQADDREILCFLYAMDGSTATESWEGSGI